MKQIRYFIAVLLMVALAAPAIAQEEKEKCQALSCFIQSAKIQYQHVYKRSKLRDDLYHCIDLLQEASGKFPSRPEVYYMLGTFYAEINALDTMVAYFDSAKTFCDDKAVPEEFRANCYAKDNYIKKMTAMRQDFWEREYNDGVTYLLQYDTVQAMIGRAPSPDSAKVLETVKARAYDLTKTSFEKAIIAKPSEERTYDGLAAIMEREGKHEDAISLYKKAIELLGEDSVMVGRIAYACINIPDWPNAITWFEKYLTYVPDDINSLINLSVAYNASDNVEKWYEYTSRVLKIQPKNTQFLFNAGQYWFVRMQEMAGEMAMITDSTPAGMAKRAELEAKINSDRDSAAAYFEENVRVSPEDKDALKRLGILYLLSGENHKAIAAFEQHITLDATDPDVLDFLGRAYINLEQFEKAIGTYEQLLIIQPSNADIWERLEELYRYNGMPDKADEAARKIAELKKQ